MSTASSFEDKQYVVFNLASESYGLDIALVREIITLQLITEVPHTQEFVEGITNLRGRVIPVFNLRRRFGLPDEAPTRASRIMVVEAAGNSLGIIVDGVSEVQEIKAETVEPPSPVVTGVESEYILGVAKVGERLVILLDLDRVLATSE